MAGDLIVGVGGDGSGFQAARVAARVANLMQSTLVLVFGYEAVAMGPRGGALEEQIEAVGDSAVAEIRAELAGTYPNLTIEVEMVQERPVDALINAAAARNAEAIAVGHGGSGPLKAALLGSITYEIVHRAPIPVLVVPNDEADTE
ncbi:MAG: universal stress protein [Ilumatobacteraceae bacterium]|nr:universal stress protein [Acidimicrobiaceae bacterium]HQY16740.1 universal stress protein [Ilumatobacteraceae bacterium]